MESSTPLLKYTFNCICGQSASQLQKLKEHYKECEIMQLSYSEILKPWEAYNQNSEDLSSLQNLYEISEMVNSTIRQKINLLMGGKQNEVPIQQEEEEKNEMIKAKLLPQVFDEQLYLDQKDQVNQYETCKYCEEKISPTDEKEQRILILQSTECFHILHKQCLEDLTYEATRNSEQIKCPECDAVIQQMEIKENLSKKAMDEIEKLAQLQLLSQNENFVSCSCGNIMEVVQGDVQRGIKDDQGNIITQECAVHMSKFRVRCSQCKKNFCSQCQSQPYHIGKNCQQFKDYEAASKCRFCQQKILQAPPSVKPAFKDVCRSAACMEIMGKSCDKLLTGCQHPCCGFFDEIDCMPCLNEECVKKDESKTLGQNSDSYCSICQVDGLGAMPCVQLTCNHIYHVDCVINRLSSKCDGPRIAFNYIECPQCKKHIDAPHCEAINLIMYEEKQDYNYVAKKSVEMARNMGLEKDLRLQDPDDPYYDNFQEYALQRLAFYQCYKCKIPYFGGLKECGEMLVQNQKEFNPEELVCGVCSGVKDQKGGLKNCKNHGSDYIQYKCKNCCSLAIWFCFGTTHFCDRCHSEGLYNVSQQCLGMRCPFKQEHPPNGNEYGFGCGLCRDLGMEWIPSDDLYNPYLDYDNLEYDEAYLYRRRLQQAQPVNKHNKKKKPIKKNVKHRR